MDVQQRIFEVIEDIHEQLEELFDETENPDILEIKIFKLQEKSQEFIYDFQREAESLEIMRIGE